MRRYLLALALVAGCIEPADTYVCSTSAQCLHGGQQGSCESNGYCSFEDMTCPSGKRFGELAPADLAKQCVVSTIACGDGMDNDADGLIDGLDPGCKSPDDPDEHGDDVCDDGIDQDGDGKADYRVDGQGDPGCNAAIDASERSMIACDNGTAEDGDGLSDFKMDGTGDPGCTGPDDDDEHGTAQCDNAVDDDNDGRLDYLANGSGDPGCTGADDASEHSAVACDDGI